MPTYTKETALYDTGAIKDGIDDAGTKADNYLTDVTGGGVMVHPSDDDTSGWKISSALELLKSGISYIWAGLVNSIATVRIGKETGGHSVIDENGMRVYGGGSGTAQIANLGYGSTQSESSTSQSAPYYDLGARGSTGTPSSVTNPYKGAYSVVEGYNSTAMQAYSHAEGLYCDATAVASHAQGIYTAATNKAQTVIGSGSLVGSLTPSSTTHPSGHNKFGQFAFVIGNGGNGGTSGSGYSAVSNALAIDWTGKIYTYVGPTRTGLSAFSNWTSAGNLKVGKITLNSSGGVSSTEDVSLATVDWVTGKNYGTITTSELKDTKSISSTAAGGTGTATFSLSVPSGYTITGIKSLYFSSHPGAFNIMGWNLNNDGSLTVNYRNVGASSYTDTLTVEVQTIKIG